MLSKIIYHPLGHVLNSDELSFEEKINSVLATIPTDKFVSLKIGRNDGTLVAIIIYNE